MVLMREYRGWRYWIGVRDRVGCGLGRGGREGVVMG